MAKLLGGETLVLSDGSKVNAKEYLKDKVVALYFSAGWCPACLAFTSKLKKYYETLKEAGKNFEVIFVSSDRAAEDLIEYYRDHHGPWTYLEFGNPKIQELLTKFEVKTIPTCRVITTDGTVVVNDARTEVQEKGVEDAIALWDEWMAFYVSSLSESSTDEISSTNISLLQSSSADTHFSLSPTSATVTTAVEEELPMARSRSSSLARAFQDYFSQSTSSLLIECGTVSVSIGVVAIAIGFFIIKRSSIKETTATIIQMVKRKKGDQSVV